MEVCICEKCGKRHRPLKRVDTVARAKIAAAARWAADRAMEKLVKRSEFEQAVVETNDAISKMKTDFAKSTHARIDREMTAKASRPRDSVETAQERMQRKYIEKMEKR